MLRPMEAALEESEEAPVSLEKDQPSELEKEKSIFEMDDLDAYVPKGKR